MQQQQRSSEAWCRPLRLREPASACVQGAVVVVARGQAQAHWTRELIYRIMGRTLVVADGLWGLAVGGWDSSFVMVMVRAKLSLDRRCVSSPRGRAPAAPVLRRDASSVGLSSKLRADEGAALLESVRFLNAKKENAEDRIRPSFDPRGRGL